MITDEEWPSWLKEYLCATRMTDEYNNDAYQTYIDAMYVLALEVVGLW